MPQDGDYVCVRSANQGVVFGNLVWCYGREARIRNARQQYDWSANALTLFDLINKDPNTTGLRLSETIEEIDMKEICGILLIPQKMVDKFINHPAAVV